MNEEDRTAALALAAGLAPLQVRAVLAWTAVVDIEPRRALGRGALGDRFIVPITGGWFEGTPQHPLLRGRVLPGGADRQLLRADGVKELHALYEMQADDGTVLTVKNRVLVDETVQPQRYAMAHLSVQAPEGPHAWLNRRRFTGTLQVLRPSRDAVLVRAYVLDAAPG